MNRAQAPAGTAVFFRQGSDWKYNETGIRQGQEKEQGDLELTGVRPDLSSDLRRHCGSLRCAVTSLIWYLLYIYKVHFYTNQ